MLKAHPTVSQIKKILTYFTKSGMLFIGKGYHK